MKVCESISQTVVLYIFVLIFHFEWSRALDKKRINRKRRDCKDIDLRNVLLYSIDKDYWRRNKTKEICQKIFKKLVFSYYYVRGGVGGG